MEVLPFSLVKFLNEWEVRVFIILSLMLQILLMLLGNRRKYVCKLWMRIILWCAYLLADWVAVVTLGIIAKNTLDKCQNKINDDPKIELSWFWAQFILLHLGGPDTITAYSLEDNELWLRHLVGMVIQTGLAFYALLVSFPGSYWLPSSSVLVFLAGLIKYMERLSTLCAANSENFSDSMLPEPDPGPNYPKFMEEYTLKKAEGFYVKVDEDVKIPIPSYHDFPNQPGIPEASENFSDSMLPEPDPGPNDAKFMEENTLKKAVSIPEAYDLFSKFKGLFAGAILSFQDRDSSKSYFQNLTSEQAFQVVEIELGFMFDELYTKASTVYNASGCVLRIITLSLTLLAWMAFQFICDKTDYSKHDLAITHLLLLMAICLEIYGFLLFVASDWMLSRHKPSSFRRLMIQFRRLMIQWFRRPIKKRWSKKMAQHNLLHLCLVEKKKPAVFPRRIRRLTKIDNYIEKHWHKSFVDVSTELKGVIFMELNSYTNESDPAARWIRKGSFALEKFTSLSLDWMREMEFDQRILIWHIATDICYSLEASDNGSNNTAQHSKQISDYMLYLLIVCPFMLPIGIGMVRFRDTCAEAREFLRERDAISGKVEACETILEVNTRVSPAQVKGDRSKSVLFDACKLARSLREEERKWEIMSTVWVEMLAYAATRCGGSHHARQLRKGGEMLSHVWLLMAHLGITEQFQISQGHARAKLIVK